mgnify:CR=1 FL=1
MTQEEFKKHNKKGNMPCNWIGQGTGYKDKWDPEKPDEIIYIPENAYHSKEGRITARDGFTIRDFISLTRGNEIYAKTLFEYVDWQYPTSALEEVLNAYAENEELTALHGHNRREYV